MINIQQGALGTFEQYTLALSTVPVQARGDIVDQRLYLFGKVHRIIQQLLEGAKRFNQLQRELPGVTHRTLAKQLREMADDGLVERRDYREIPPRVEYRLSPLGLTLKDILMAMHAWAEKHGHRVAG